VTGLDQSLALEPAGEGAHAAHADPAYKGGANMFGGWLAAIMLKAVLADAAAAGAPCAMTFNFIQGVPENSAITLKTQRLGGGRSLAHWRCDLFAEGVGLAVTATVVLATRRDSARLTQAAAPEAPRPETLGEWHPPTRFGQNVDVRYVTAAPWPNPGTTRSICWIRDMEQRAVDALQLLVYCDALAPRSFFITPGPGPSATITLSLYIHATADELAAVGGDFVLQEVTGTRIEQSTSGSQCNLWSRDGVLLATSEQLEWFK